ncbi:hypothetical protein RQP46_006148 [Phenoliferia psychrophenolica]
MGILLTPSSRTATPSTAPNRTNITRRLKRASLPLQRGCPSSLPKSGAVGRIVEAWEKSLNRKCRLDDELHVAHLRLHSRCAIALPRTPRELLDVSEDAILRSWSKSLLPEHEHPFRPSRFLPSSLAARVDYYLTLHYNLSRLEGEELQNDCYDYAIMPLADALGLDLKRYVETNEGALVDARDKPAEGGVTLAELGRDAKGRLEVRWGWPVKS